jgi:hypothetical protein
MHIIGALALGEGCPFMLMIAWYYITWYYTNGKTIGPSRNRYPLYKHTQIVPASLLRKAFKRYKKLLELLGTVLVGKSARSGTVTEPSVSALEGCDARLELDNLLIFFAELALSLAPVNPVDAILVQAVDEFL